MMHQCFLCQESFDKVIDFFEHFWMRHLEKVEHGNWYCLCGHPTTSPYWLAQHCRKSPVPLRSPKTGDPEDDFAGSDVEDLATHWHDFVNGMGEDRYAPWTYSTGNWRSAK